MRLSATLLALAIGALGLAACGDEDEGDGGSATSSDAVAVENIDGADVLVDSGGRALYTADVEQEGEILCTGACASVWEPALGSDADAQAAADDLGVPVGVVERPDGGRQLTLDGAPLYSFADEGPGELTGDGFADDFRGTTFTWSAAAAEGATPESEAGGSGYSGGY